MALTFLRQRWKTFTAVVAGSTLLLAAAAIGVIGWVGSQRAIHPGVDEPTHTLAGFGLEAEDVRFESRDGTTIAAWFVRGEGKQGATVLLLHGYGQSRAELLPHAAYLHDDGYNVLLIDFRGCGESGGNGVTLGAHEPLDVMAAIDYLQARPEVDQRRIAVQGVSLGASAGIMAAAEDGRIVAVVAKSAFTDVRATVARSFEYYIGLPAFPFAPVSVFISERRLGADMDDVRPIDSVARLGTRPVFIIDDLDDQRIPDRSGEKLYAAASGPKELWLIAGAGHADGFKFEPLAYRAKVLSFLEAQL
ncbi:MAG: alpha/beta hydrolase [Tepidiformaceae bacterium]